MLRQLLDLALVERVVDEVLAVTAKLGSIEPGDVKASRQARQHPRVERGIQQHAAEG